MLSLKRMLLYLVRTKILYEWEARRLVCVEYFLETERH